MGDITEIEARVNSRMRTWKKTLPGDKRELSLGLKAKASFVCLLVFGFWITPRNAHSLLLAPNSVAMLRGPYRMDA